MKLNTGAPPDVVTVRRKKGVSLKEISQASKIGVNYLQAIEDGDFAKLPGGVYSVSYIRQYASAIDYNESELLEWYYRVTGIESESEPAPAAGTRTGRKIFSDLLRPVMRVLG